MKASDEKPERNYDGDMPSDVPSEKLKHKPKKHSGQVNRDSGRNTTAKDPKLGVRHTTR
ncbi:MAG: hypothetical protein K0S09_2403 [Sphingobacteriaceae bacterium]|jgi:hypothetical protein|nr:hypothetical protein [Sphingobacteriaceae bacterium]